MAAADLDEVNPSREDGFVRGVSELVGGPVGEHAATSHPLERTFTPARVIMALAALVFGLHWVQKSPCQDGELGEQRAVHAVLLHRHPRAVLRRAPDEGAVPYFDWPVEYPVLTGYFMGVLGLPVHDIGDGNPQFNQGSGVLQPQRARAERLRLGRDRGRPRAAPPATVGRIDVRRSHRLSSSPRP